MDNIPIINLSEITPPEPLCKNFVFVKAYCHTFQLNVTKLDFNTPKYDIVIECYDSEKKYRFSFNFHSRDTTQPSALDMDILEEL